MSKPNQSAKPETVKVKLTSARAGHSYDRHGRFTGVFAQAAGDVVEMSAEEAERHVERGLATHVAADAK